jgi:hypothetical protein
MTVVEFSPVTLDDGISLKEYQKIPFEGIAALGSAFAQIPQAFRTVTSTMGGGQQLYTLNMRGLDGTLSSLGGDGVNMLTGVYNETGIIGNAVYNPVANPSMVTTMPINPAMLCMSVALISIEKKLEVIAQTQQQILSFLEQKNESELIGNLKFLSDVLNNFKFNYENERYKTNMHIKALDIKQISEQNIIFYKKQITELINKRSSVHVNQQTDKLLLDVQNKFKYYKLALYQYSFASFLEILLLENFEHNYLEKIAKTINDQSIEYKEFYTECYDKIEHNVQTSVESVFLSRLSKVSEAAGEAVAKVPVISKSQIDEGLISGGKKLHELGSKKVEKTMEQFRENKADETMVFAENIRNVDKLYNSSMRLLFDGSNIYIKSIA